MDALRKICFILLNELRAYELLIEEISSQVEPAFLQRRLRHSRRRSKLGLGGVEKYLEIEQQIKELGLLDEWRALLREHVKRKKPSVN